MSTPLPRKVKVVGLLSRPRFGPLDSQWCMGALQEAHGIPIRIRGGAYWEQGIQTLLEEAVSDGFDLACTFDYDSIFTVTNFNTLLAHMVENPDCDAVAALQPMRGRDNTALFAPVTGEGAPAVALDKPIIAKTAHFGLTLIRLDRLKDISLPWFKSTPASDGTWKHERGAEDADIHFWRIWHQAGRTLHVLPWVCIGQVETKFLMCERGTGKTISVYPKHWLNENFGRKQVGA